MREYTVIPFKTSLVSGNIDERKLAETLNEYARQGWRLVRTIHETRRALGVFKREAHFLVMERETA